MRTKAAIIRQPGQEAWEIIDVDIDDPKAGEVQVKLAASGLCHSDEHLLTGDLVFEKYPLMGGHEGAGVVTKVGEGVIGLEEGDHVVLAFIPACGVCGPCSEGLQNLCDNGAGLLSGRAISDDGYRVHTAAGEDVGTMCLLGTFAPHVTVHQSSVVKIEKDIPLDKAALLGCGVATGWGSATEIGGAKEGEIVVVVGIGGIGINSVQGAAAAGARAIVAVDPVEFKREKALEFGATHTCASMDEAMELVGQISWGKMADLVLLTMGFVDGKDLLPGLLLTGKGRRCIVVGLGNMMAVDAQVSILDLAMQQKTLQGAIFGGVGPRKQVPHLLHQYRAGNLKLDELVTRTYRLEDINQGYQDMRDGKNIRGVIIYDEQDW